MNAARRQRLWERVRSEAGPVQALLVTEEANRYYLSGFRGDAGWLLVRPDGADLLVDGRFWTQAEQEAPDVGLVRVRGGEPADYLGPLLRQHGVQALAFEADHVPYAEVQRWQRQWEGVQLVPTVGLCAAERVVKDAGELAAMRRAAEITDRAFAAVLSRLGSGRSEAELAAELEYAMRREGAEGVAFPSIVAAGPNGALPHARPGSAVLQPGQLVVMDFGARYAGYCADMTRTVAVGGLEPEAARVLEVVERALAAALAVLRPGVAARAVDAAARSVIEEAGYGSLFNHGTGHGVGLWIHEAPRLASTAGEQLVPKGAVVTVEPGVYLPGRFGVRLEEMVYVGGDGPVVLSRSPLRNAVAG